MARVEPKDHALHAMKSAPIVSRVLIPGGYVQLTRSQIEKILMKSARGRLVLTTLGEPFQLTHECIQLVPEQPLVVHLSDLYVAAAALEAIGVRPAAPIANGTGPLTAAERGKADGIIEKLVHMFIYTHVHFGVQWIEQGAGESPAAVADRLWAFLAPARSDYRNKRYEHTNGPAVKRYVARSLAESEPDPDLPPSFRFIATVLRSSFAAWPKGSDRGLSKLNSFARFQSFSNARSPLHRAGDISARFMDWQKIPELRRL